MRAFAVQKGSYFVTIAADGHRAPAAAVGAGIIIKEETASRIGATPDRRFGAFGEEFRRGTGDSCEQPVQAFFTRKELKAPHAVDHHQLIVTFGDAENFVDGLRPYAWERAFLASGRKNGAKGFPETQHFE